jgi:hypothetical protein
MSLLNVKRDFTGIDLGAPGRWYTKSIGAHPLAETATLAAAGGLAGKFGGGLLLKGLIKLTGATMSPETQKVIDDYMEDPEGYSKATNLMALLGVGLGGAAGVAKNIDIRNGWRGAAESMYDSDYWKKHPDRASAKRHAYWQKMLNRPYRIQEGFVSGRTPMERQAADASYLEEDVPIHQSLQVIDRDPFLTLGQKSRVGGLFAGAENMTAGYTSGQKLARSALKAGVGFGTAYIFGQVAGRVFGLPEPVLDRMSAIGGVAGALANTGIFSGK